MDASPGRDKRGEMDRRTDHGGWMQPRRISSEDVPERFLGILHGSVQFLFPLLLLSLPFLPLDLALTIVHPILRDVSQSLRVSGALSKYTGILHRVLDPQRSATVKISTFGILLEKYARNCEGNGDGLMGQISQLNIQVALDLG